ncbi:A disintegrin and metalloproteinase with thrombospondin motifs adt-2-like isoform X1 [Linepithema humile]|uniref:A disintegrin and metalloproteinase with thrombospondin motifs adt-2-like isoform X1 n=1 Tax=Linepithema humile TaxID=83485 RepID=UPI00351DAD03
MFLLLKFTLIILINKTYAYITQDSEIILLPAWNPTGAKEIPLTLKVFGKLMQLNLRRNDQIVSPAFKARKYNAKIITEKLSQLKASDPCFFLHENHVSSAAINFCQEHGLKGLIFVENDIIEIWSLRNVLASLSFIDDVCVREQINQSFGKPHLIKRIVQYYSHSNFYPLDNLQRKPRYVENKKMDDEYIIELAIFVDTDAYLKLMSYLDNDIEKIRNMIELKYVKKIQNFFHHQSLGVRIGISVVNVTIFETKSSNFPVFDGEAESMLKLFCSYQKTLNPPDDDDPRHWDIALYITGINIFVTRALVSTSYNDYSATGISLIGGACKAHKSCAIVEFSSGDFDSSIKKSTVYAAHEIGHLLGLHHDLDKTDTYIMSPAPQRFSELKWFVYSQNTIKSSLKRKSCLREIDDSIYVDGYDDWWTSDIFDNPLYHGLPGRKWTAKAQCEQFLRDENANVVTLHDICQNLQCETPHKNGSYFTVPALNGTYCALGKECRGGKCAPILEPPYNFKICNKDNWSEWVEDSCKSSCLQKSKGVLAKRRFCKHRLHKTPNCMGSYYDVVLCDDSLLCTRKHKTVVYFAFKKCLKYIKLANDTNLSITKPGKQYSHNAEKSWIACTVYCAHKESSDYYTPRQEMLNLRVDPYFPDGTWCHEENGQNYYCRQHHCLPESYSQE